MAILRSIARAAVSVLRGKRPNMGILDQYAKGSPSDQTALDIFKDEWSSRFPGERSDLKAGESPLFEDGRVTWCLSQIGGVSGKTILELGPLEGGHTYQFDRAGARDIVAIEANTRGYLKCLVAKEVLGMPASHFLCGDFVEYLRTNENQYDLCFASGVLYHMKNPAEMIALAAKSADHLFLWTHYYDPEIVSKNLRIAHRFGSGEASVYKDFKHTLYRQEYTQAPSAYLRNWRGFCGGPEEISHWMTREDILACLQHFGMNKIQVGDENREHPNGPCFSLIASR
ncbi:MAG: DUF1698 domain-containing protein [Armatimonadota bacterium]